MARSVSVPFNAQRVLYINLYDFENYFDQEYALDDFIQAICKRYPSLSPSRKWVGREDLGLAENAHAVVGVSTFCGLGAVWVTPKAGESHLLHLGRQHEARIHPGRCPRTPRAAIAEDRNSEQW